jgi:hypothetical protein
MYYNEVLLAHGNDHLVILTMRNRARELEITHDILQQWSTALKEWFIQANSPFMRLKEATSALEVSLKDSITTVIESADRQYVSNVKCNETLCRLDHQVQVLTRKSEESSTLLAGALQQTQCLMQQNQYLIQQNQILITELFRLNSSPGGLPLVATDSSGVVASIALSSPPVPTPPVGFFNIFNLPSATQQTTSSQGASQTSDTSANPTSENVDTVRKSLPVEFKKEGGLKDWSVSRILNTWYMDELHKCVPRDNVEVQILNRLATLVCYCKASVPEGTVILAKPLANDTIAFQTWQENLDVFCKAAQLSVRKFRELLNPRNTGSKKRALGVSMWSVAKDLPKLEAKYMKQGKKSVFRYGATTDFATSDEYNLNYYEDVHGKTKKKKFT